MFKTRYNWSKKRIVFDPSKSLTHTEFKRETDINNIVEQYVTTGTLPTVGRKAFVRRHPMFGDFSTGTDFQTIQNTIKTHENAFMELPSRVRERFRNDPQNLIHFLSDPNNFDEAVELGLCEKKVPEKIIPVKEPNTSTMIEKSAVEGSGTAAVPAAE